MRLPIIAVMSLTLAACGTTSNERAASGAAIGAGGGAIVGAVANLGAGPSALVGTAVGAVAGAISSKERVGFGESFWKPDIHTNVVFSNPQSTPPPDPERVRAIQQGLSTLGLYDGPVNGTMSAETRDSIKAYQREEGLVVDGAPSEALLEHIQAKTH